MRLKLLIFIIPFCLWPPKIFKHCLFQKDKVISIFWKTLRVTLEIFGTVRRNCDSHKIFDTVGQICDSLTKFSALWDKIVTPTKSSTLETKLTPPQNFRHWETKFWFPYKFSALRQNSDFPTNFRHWDKIVILSFFCTRQKKSADLSLHGFICLFRFGRKLLCTISSFLKL